MATIKTELAKGSLFVVEHQGTDYHVQVNPDDTHVVWTQQKRWQMFKEDCSIRRACVAAVVTR